MRNILLSIFLIIAFCQTAFAGEWVYDENGTRYMSDDKTAVTGWHHDIDGTWYYLDDISGYMLTDTMTPDGYYVDESGAYREGGQKSNNMTSYENEMNLNTTKFGYAVPVKIHYNNSYPVSTGGEVIVSKIEVAQDGEAYILINQKNTIGAVGINQKFRLTMEDGSIKEGEKAILEFSHRINDTSFKLLSDPRLDSEVGKNKVKSAEIWITEYKTESK